jgi:hypothetical protein
MIRMTVLWIASLVVVALLAAALTSAQADRADGRIISGADIGFRVETADREGRPIGRLMVRIEGKWVEAGYSPAVRPVR